MVTAVLLAAALASGVDPRRLALLAAATYLPYVVAGLVVIYVWRSRPVEDEGRSALFCEGVASELRAGASLQTALTNAAGSVGSTVGSTEFSMPDLASAVAREFPAIGEELRLTISQAGKTGSDTAALFDEIGSLSLAQAEIRREVRTATAPGRATALVLIAAPVFYVVSRLTSGSFDRLFVSPYQRYATLLGAGLFVLGLTAVTLIVWRSGR